MTVSKMVNSKT